jgi:hypothetical protein
MKPTIGRIVHYTAQRDPETVFTYAAMITGVDHDDRFVSLTIFPPDGTTFGGLGVPFSDSPTVGCWSWPPRV